MTVFPPFSDVSSVTADALIIERGGRVVISGVSFAVKAGEALVLTGPNGTGKTTLIRALAGLLSLTGGTIQVNGGNSTGQDEAPTMAAISHYVGHRDAVKPKLTVAENVAFWAEFLGDARANPAQTDDALAACGLLDLADVPAAYLSAGQKRRLGLARLLSAPRPLWLLDEPTTALDAAHQRAFAALIERHRAEGGLVIAATHMDLGLRNARSLQLTTGSAA
jgi:heme exporter protein A